MARLPKPAKVSPAEESSIPYRVVIDFLEGTLRKQDAIAFARGFIEHHFDSLSNSGYYVTPYEGGYIFEAHEGGPQRAYLPATMDALEADPSVSVCIQMARRVLEVKRSLSGVYTAILLPEGTEPQNPDKVFPEPGPKLIPYQRSGMNVLLIGLSIFGVGFLTLLLSTIIYLVQVSGLLQAPLANIDFKSLPLTQWQTLQNVAGDKSANYVRGLRFDNNQWHTEMGQRQEFAPPPAQQPVSGQATSPVATPGVGTVPSSNPLAPPMMPAPETSATPANAASPQRGSLPAPAAPMPGNALPAPAQGTAH